MGNYVIKGKVDKIQRIVIYYWEISDQRLFRMEYKGVNYHVSNIKLLFYVIEQVDFIIEVNILQIKF